MTLAQRLLRPSDVETRVARLFPTPVLLLLAAGFGTALAVRRQRADGWSNHVHPRTAPRPIRHRITIARPPGEVYRAWTTVERMPRFMTGLASVRAENGRSHWVAVTPGGRTFEWEMHTVDMRENALVVWQSVRGPLDIRVTARFDPAPADRGTELTVALDCGASTGLAALIARAARSELRECLRRFKQWLEAGEVATVAGQPSGAAPEVRRPELRRPSTRVEGRPARDMVEQASAASFPASDPPASGVVR